MTDWTEDLSPEEATRWEAFVRHTRETTVKAATRSAIVASIVPSANELNEILRGEEIDVKFAVDLGLAILLDKPIVAVSLSGRPIPPGLRRIAHEVVELTGDFDTEARQAELAARLDAFAKRFVDDTRRDTDVAD